MFNADNQTISITVNISWTPPQDPNGVLSNYTVEIRESDTNKSLILAENIDSETVFIQWNIFARPFASHIVIVTARTEGGRTSNTSSPVLSPEAGKSQKWSKRTLYRASFG